MFEKIVTKCYDRILSARAKYQLSQFAEHGEQVSVGRFLAIL